MKPTTLKRLWRVNRSFEQVLDHLRAFRKHPGIDVGEIRHLEELVAEVCAATNSYLLETFATIETARAGRAFRKRLVRERKQERE